MHNGVSLSASLMCIDWLHAARQMEQLETGMVDYLHLDIVDGNFAPDFTMGSSIINTFREHTKLASDYHLMAEEPSRLFNAFGIDEGDIYTIHQEGSRNLHRDLVNLRRKGVKVGVALSPATPLDTLEYIIEEVDVVLLMMVNPGYKGQPLVPQTISKIHNLRTKLAEKSLPVRISVDGCVNPATIPDMVQAGADILVLGSSGLFMKDMPIPDALNRIRDAVDLGLKRRGH